MGKKLINVREKCLNILGLMCLNEDIETLEALRELILEGKIIIKGIKNGEFIFDLNSDYKAEIERQKEIYS